MLWFLGRVGFVLFAFCVILGGIRTVGIATKSPASEILAEFCSPQPCWHDINPGRTTIQSAQNLLSNDKSLALLENQPLAICWKWLNQWHFKTAWCDGNYSFSNDPDDGQKGLSLGFAQSRLTLGDLILVLGTPSTAELCQIDHVGLIYFETERVTVQVPDEKANIDPNLVVIGVDYFLPVVPQPNHYAKTTFRWKLFSPWNNLILDCFG